MQPTCKWEASPDFEVVPVPLSQPSKYTAAAEGWDHWLPDDASGAASVAVHSTQCKARESLGHNVYGDATIVEGEAFFSLTYLSGTGTHARIGVAAADGSDQTWGVSLYDGKLQVEPKPPPRSVRDMTTGIDVDEPDPPPEYLKHA